VQQQFPRHRHSDYFHRQHFTRYWVPTLMRVVVNATERNSITDILDMASQAAAASLGIATPLVRANVFVPEDQGRLGIPDGLVHNMDRPVEQTLKITAGTGSCGVAFQERAQTVAVLRHGWGGHTLPGSELAKVDPRLRWIISTPIPDPDVRGSVLGIFNVDGLDVAKEKGDLEPLLSTLVVTAQLAALKFKELA
jgi:hypothetical protein